MTVTKRDLCDDLAAIVCAAPQEGVSDEAAGQVHEERQHVADSMRLAWEENDIDPLLSAVREARRRRLQAEQDLRNLIAYAREFMHPRPYRLFDLAEAAGLSISAVRINFDDDDVALVADSLGRKPNSR